MPMGLIVCKYADHSYRAELVDKMAAAYILQGALDVG